MQRVAFHVEEKIAFVGRRQAVEAYWGGGIAWQQFELVFASLPLLQLLGCLGAQPDQGFRLHTGYTSVGWQAAQLGQGMNAVAAQALDLYLAGICNAVQVVLCFPFRGATFTPVSEAAVVTFLGKGFGAFSQKIVETLSQASVIVQIV